MTNGRLRSSRPPAKPKGWKPTPTGEITAPLVSFTVRRNEYDWPCAAVNVVLAAFAPEGMEMKGRFNVAGGGPSWAHPVVSGGRLYIRNQGLLAAYDIKAR